MNDYIVAYIATQILIGLAIATLFGAAVTSLIWWII